YDFELALGIAVITHQRDAAPLSESEKCQHDAAIDGADEQLLGRPLLARPLPLAGTPDGDVRSSFRRQHTLPRPAPGGSRPVMKGFVLALALHGSHAPLLADFILEFFGRWGDEGG